MTFRVTFLCKTKDMGEVLMRLNNIAYNVEHNFVPNVEEPKPNGKATPSIKGVDAIELFSKELHKRSTTEITGPEFRDMVIKLGLNKLSYSYFLQNLVKSGVLKKGKKMSGNAMTYHLTGK